MLGPDVAKTTIKLKAHVELPSVPIIIIKKKVCYWEHDIS
jgi:hypothetical protein